MTKSSDILDGLQAALERIYPDMLCYREFVAQDLQRPCFVVGTRFPSMTDRTVDSVFVTVELRIDILLPVDGHYQAMDSALSEAALHVMSALAATPIVIDGTALIVQTTENRDGGTDFTSVYATLMYAEARQNNIEPVNLMEYLSLTVAPREE